MKAECGDPALAAVATAKLRAAGAPPLAAVAGEKLVEGDALHALEPRQRGQVVETRETDNTSDEE